jgi:hypothetical protein
MIMLISLICLRSTSFNVADFWSHIWVRMRSCRQGRHQFKKGRMMRTPRVHLHQQHLLLLQHRQHRLRYHLLGQLLGPVQESSTSSWCWIMKARKTIGWPNRRPYAWTPRTSPRGRLVLHPRTHNTRGGAPLLAAPPIGDAPPLLVRVLYLLQLEFCFTSSFSYTRNNTNMCCPLWFRTPPSSDIKIAHLKFLFVLRLRTKIDLRDLADLAPARWRIRWRLERGGEWIGAGKNTSQRTRPIP